MQRAIFWTLFIIIVGAIIIYLPSLDPQSRGDNTQLANPASAYCIDQGGTLDIREDAEGNQAGVCVFEDTECDEWAFYRNEVCLNHVPAISEPLSSSDALSSYVDDLVT